MSKPTDLQFVVVFFVAVAIWGYLAISFLHCMEN